MFVPLQCNNKEHYKGKGKTLKYSFLHNSIKRVNFFKT